MTNGQKILATLGVTAVILVGGALAVPHVIGAFVDAKIEKVVTTVKEETKVVSEKLAPAIEKAGDKVEAASENIREGLGKLGDKVKEHLK